MNNLLEDLKNVNPKMPGSWPMPIKLGAFALMLIGVIVAGAVLDWQDEWDRLTVIRAEENTLKEAYLAKKKQAVNLDLIKKQLIETQQAFGALLKQLPTKSEMAALLTDINQAGLGRGLLFDLFRPGPEVATGVFTEQPITIKVTGSYDDLGKFASDISMMPRIVTLNNISIVPGTGAGGQLVMDATAKTYRYLDDAELSAQKKPAGAKRK
ncbi:MAG: type 4a pilus biogenesis protein PilO [Gallionellaceae bacterium]|jgi:type IV pilus assembly protein PilO